MFILLNDVVMRRIFLAKDGILESHLDELFNRDWKQLISSKDEFKAFFYLDYIVAFTN